MINKLPTFGIFGSIGEGLRDAGAFGTIGDGRQQRAARQSAVEKCTTLDETPCWAYTANMNAQEIAAVLENVEHNTHTVPPPNPNSFWGDAAGPDADGGHDAGHETGHETGPDASPEPVPHHIGTSAGPVPVQQPVPPMPSPSPPSPSPSPSPKDSRDSQEARDARDDDDSDDDRQDGDSKNKKNKKKKKKRTQKMPKLLDIDVDDANSIFENCKTLRQRRDVGYLAIHKSLQLGCNRTYGAARRKLAKWCESNCISDTDSEELIHYLNELFLAGFVYEGVVHKNFVDVPEDMELTNHNKMGTEMFFQAEEGRQIPTLKYHLKNSKTQIELDVSDEAVQAVGHHNFRTKDDILINPQGTEIAGTLLGMCQGILYWEEAGTEGAVPIAKDGDKEEAAMIMSSAKPWIKTGSELSGVPSSITSITMRTHQPGTDYTSAKCQGQILFPQDVTMELLVFDKMPDSMSKYKVNHGDKIKIKSGETGIVVGTRDNTLWWLDDTPGRTGATPIAPAEEEALEAVKDHELISREVLAATMWNGFKYSKIPEELTLDDPVFVKRKTGRERGVIKYIGFPDFKKGVDYDGCWIGVALDSPTGNHDGVVDGVRYFKCKPKHGVFVRADKMELDDGKISGQVFLYPQHSTRRLLRFDIRLEALKKYGVEHGDRIRSKHDANHTATIVGVRNDLLYVHLDRAGVTGAWPLRRSVKETQKCLKKYKIIGHIKLKNFVKEMMTAPPEELKKGSTHIPDEITENLGLVEGSEGSLQAEPLSRRWEKHRTGKILSFLNSMLKTKTKEKEPEK
eukprot:TRINITY_DN1218_c0_g1_i1.p1 TRINITY_DN1218_c0_g1~~TRINITY_DN1218_c0_g1_i1.p1  ORF type:complete len:795 (+),score=253.94 TRINITY_DN1218_c0_g1_i1:37-2421(+)